MALRLLVGPNKEIVDTKDIGSVSLSFKIADVNNYGKRNCSFSKPIQILQTPTTNKIFKNLFDLNTTSSLNSSKEVYGELQDDGIPILKGSLQCKVKGDYYEVVLYTNNINLIYTLGDKLIAGNDSSINDLNFTTTAYNHVNDVSTVKYYLNRDVSDSGYGFMYAICDYGDLNETKKYITTPYKSSRPTASDYSIVRLDASIVDLYYGGGLFPHVAAYQIFEKIFEDNDYEFELSSEIQNKLKKIYIPYNRNDFNVGDVSISKYFLGDPYFDTTYYATPKNWALRAQVPYCQLGHYFNNIAYVSGITQPGYDIYRQNLVPESYSTFFPIYEKGTYHLRLRTEIKSSDIHTKNVTYTIVIYNNSNERNEIDLDYSTQDTSIGGIGTKKIIDSSINVEVNGPSRVYIINKSLNDPIYSADTFGSIYTQPGKDTFLEITKLNSVKPTAFTLNKILPLNYKQSDFLEDIFKAFNIKIEVDKLNDKKIKLSTYNEFINSSNNIHDLTNNVNEETIEYEVLKNTISKTFKYSHNVSKDLFSQDFSDNFELSFNDYNIENDSYFASGENEIKLTSASTTFRKLNHGLQSKIPTFNSGDFNTLINPRLLFGSSNVINTNKITLGADYKVSISDKYTTVIGTAESTTYNIIDVSTSDKLIRFNTLSNKFRGVNYNTGGVDISTFIDYSDDVALQFNTSNTYEDYDANLKETNRTLFNKYYKEELDKLLDDNCFLLKCKAILSSEFIRNFRFADKVYLNIKKIGPSLFYINSIKNWTSSSTFCDLELIKINYYNSTYDTSTNVKYYTLLDNTTSSGSSGSGSSSSGSGSSGSVDLTNYVQKSTLGTEFSYDASGLLHVSTGSGNVKTDTINTNSTLANKNIAYFDSSLNLKTSDNFYYDASLSLVAIKQNSAVNSIIQLNLNGDQNNDLLGNLFINGKTTPNKRLVAGINTTSNYGYLQSYENTVGFQPIKLNPLGGNIYLGNGGTTYLNAGTLEVGDGGVINFGNGFYAQTTNESTGDFYLTGNDGPIFEYLDGFFITPNTEFLNTVTCASTLTSYSLRAKSIDVSTSINTINKSNNFAASSDFLGTGGTGFSISSSEGKHTLEIDNIKIRGNLSASELIINKIRATNGSLFVSDCGKVKTGLLAGGYFVCEDTNPFAPNDIIISKAFNNGAYTFIYKVSSVSAGGNVYVTNENGSAATIVDLTGKEFIRVGNTSDSSRRGSIYMTSSDTNNPYLAVIDDVSTSTISISEHKVRIGNLAGLSTSDGSTLSGFGIYTNNGYFEGKLISTTGKIGGWDINPNAISTPLTRLKNNGNIELVRDDDSSTAASINFYRDASGTETIQGNITTGLAVLGNYASKQSTLTIAALTETARGAYGQSAIHIMDNDFNPSSERRKILMNAQVNILGRSVKGGTSFTSSIAEEIAQNELIVTTDTSITLPAPGTNKENTDYFMAGKMFVICKIGSGNLTISGLVAGATKVITNNNAARFIYTSSGWFTFV